MQRNTKLGEWKEIEAGRIRPFKERRKKMLDEGLQEKECGVVRLPPCRGAKPLF